MSHPDDTIDLNIPTNGLGYNPDSDRGTSTADWEAPMRDIGRKLWGIRYPNDVTPKIVRRLPPPLTHGLH